VIYLYFGMQDIAGLLADGFRNSYQGVSAGDEAGSLGLNLMTQLLLSIKQGSVPAYSEISGMTTAAKLDIIVPQIETAMASALPSTIMSYGIISGVWAWFVSSELIKRRASAKKPLPGIKEYKPYPPFSEWKLPKWLTNVLMVLLLASIIISFAAQGAMLNAASALQTVAVVILSIQGLSVVNWWLKKKKVAAVLNVAICVVIALLSFFLNLILPLIGLIDIMFSVRMSDKQKEAIRKRMEEIKKQVDEQMKELDEKKKEEDENKDKDDEKDSDEHEGKDESGDKK
jgi:ABC-type multidrug transport system fused ATPase/permease subunit